MISCLLFRRNVTICSTNQDKPSNSTQGETKSLTLIDLQFCLFADITLLRLFELGTPHDRCAILAIWKTFLYRQKMYGEVSNKSPDFFWPTFKIKVWESIMGCQSNEVLGYYIMPSAFCRIFAISLLHSSYFAKQVKTKSCLQGGKS